MSNELYFIYDSHCPWSYAATPLVNLLEKSFPDLIIHCWHCAHYDGSDSAGFDQIKAAEKTSSVKFSKDHLRYADSPKNAILSANIMAWLSSKEPKKVLPFLNALQHAHFIEGIPMASKRDFAGIAEQLKLSMPNKVFKEELSEDAHQQLSDIAEVQEFMGTTAFPSMLLISGDEATLLNHAQYLKNPREVVDAVEMLLG